MVQRNLYLRVFLICAFCFFCLFRNVNAISCTCSSCSECNAALNDNLNCPLGVNLTVDITNFAGTCINNPANFSNKIFDCQGHVIDGDDLGYDYGIYLSGKQNNTIKNCVITDFFNGIRLFSSSNNNLTDNIVNSNYYGIRSTYSSNNNFIGNNLSYNKYGIFLEDSSNNTLINNTANSNDIYGISLSSSSNNTLENNTMANNKYNFIIEGGAILHFYQNIDTSNTVDGKPIYYWTGETAPNNCKDAEIDESSNAGFVALVSCDNITVRNLNLIKNNSHGILLVNTTNSSVLNNTVSSNAHGIYLFSSSNNTLINNTANSNDQYGIYLYFSDNNILNFNMICKNNKLNMGYYDISNYGLGNSGDNNICDTVYNWNDLSTWNCKYTCDGRQRVIFRFPLYFGWNLISFPVSLDV